MVDKFCFYVVAGEATVGKNDKVEELSVRFVPKFVVSSSETGS